MDIPLILARLLHIGLGAFWVGTMFFNALFLGPALQDIGPDAAKVGAALVRRRMMLVMPIVAILTLLSGFWLYWRVSGGFAPGYMGSNQGRTLGVGGVAALLAFVVGMILVRPAMGRAAALTQSAAQASGAERETQMAEAQAARNRSAVGGRWVSWLLGLALVAMAIARYV
jgi:hypothetical protein